MQKDDTSVCWVVKFAFGLLLVVLVIVVGAFLSQERTQSGAGSSGTSARLAAPRALAPFQLARGDGGTLTAADLQGKWTLLFFGYTHCPDVCPTTLAELDRLYHLLEQDPGVLADTQFVFVSVDPARDTTALLTDYVHYFNPAFIGATGDEPQLEALAKQFSVGYRREKGDGQAYAVDHSSAVLLVDPQVRYYARLRAPHNSQDMRGQYLNLRRQYLNQTNRG